MNPAVAGSEATEAYRSTASTCKPRICFVSHMVGRNPGYVTTQGLILSDLFREAGYPISAVSSQRNKFMRLADITANLALKQRSIDIVVIDVFSGPSFLVAEVASMLSKLCGYGIVMCLRGGALPQFMARFPNWTRRVLKRAHTVVAPSEFLARAAVASGLAAQVVPNVVDLSVYQYRHRQKLEPRLFWMRSFHTIYDPEMAVRVLARLHEQVPSATLVMAGQDKGAQEDVRQLVQSLGLNDAVRFPGFLDIEGKLQEGNAADIFINTNRVDNMPVAVVEACAMGLPVVATAVGGIPDLLADGESGLLVPEGDDRSMAEAVLRLLYDPVLAGSLSANGRALAERSSWPQMRMQWEQIFAAVMAARRHRRQGGNRETSGPRSDSNPVCQ